MNINEIREASQNNRTLVAVSQAIITNRWHENPCVKPYQRIKNELSDNNGIILRGERIILPSSLKSKMLNLVHEGHLGIEKCKSLLRRKVYWPSMDTDIEKHVNDCTSCIANSKDPKPEPIKSSELPEQPWAEIAIDFYGPVPTGEKLLVITDLYSRFPFIEYMRSTDADAVINRLNKLFTTFGFVNRVRSDNGPPFNSTKLKKYFNDHDIMHTKITPLHPQANGCVEKFMQVISKSIKTAVYENRNWRKALDDTLLNYRTSTHCTTGKTPALLFFGRDIKNKIPNFTISKSPFDKEVRDRQKLRYEKSKSKTDKVRHAVESDVKTGDTVILKRLKKGNKFDSKFYKRRYKVISKQGALLIIQDPHGNRLARNTSFVKRINPEIEAKPCETIEANDKTKLIEQSQEVDKKQYPKRNRKTLYK